MLAIRKMEMLAIRNRLFSQPGKVREAGPEYKGLEAGKSVLTRRATVKVLWLCLWALGAYDSEIPKITPFLKPLIKAVAFQRQPE